MAFRIKQSIDKVSRTIDLAQRLKPELAAELMELKQWAAQHKRYCEMFKAGTLWAEGYEKVKQVLRNMYQSPIDFGNIYFDVDKRLKIAAEIKQDLKTVLDENNFTNKRIKLSRVEYDINHFEKNCQIS